MDSYKFNSLWRSNKMQFTTFVIAVTFIAAALPVKSTPVALYDSSYSQPPPPPVYNPPASYNPPPENSDGYLEVYQMQNPGYYNTPAEEYSQPPVANSPSSTYQSQIPYNSQENYPPPPPVNYNPPQNNYQPPAVYNPPQSNYYQPPPPEVYNPPPQNNYYQPPAVYNPPQPNYYQPPPPEVYSPPPQPIYYAPPEIYRPSVSYAPSPYYNPPQYQERPKYEVEKLSYEAVTYRNLNDSIQCGVFAAVNADLYKDTYLHKEYASNYSQYGTALLEKDDVVPFGLCPWSVKITDDYNNYLCGATVVHNRQILTLASCIQGRPLEKLRVRYGDWDVLNDVNEYEAYKNYETRICRTLPVTCPSTYGYSDSVGQLILLQVDIVEDYDKYPQTKPICLPEWPYNPPVYSPPPYAPPAPIYNQPQGYNVPQVYSPPAISYYAPPPPPPSYYQEPEVYTECWLEGYYSSPITELKNHQPPQPVSDGYYSYPAKDYNPYGANYYAEKSKLPRRAQVKRIEKPYQQPPQYGYKAAPPQPQCDDEQQWVGVNGFDACVADVGTAIVCIVLEKENYEAGYQNDDAYDGQSQYQQPPQYDSYTPYKEIKAAPSPNKEPRRRAVIVAVVKSTTDCTDYEQSYDSYGSANPYEKQQSKPITAVKVNSNAVSFVLDKFWEGALDYSCPAPKASYPEPNYYPETIKPKVYKPAPYKYSVPQYPPPRPAPEPYYSYPPQYPPIMAQ